MAVLATSLNHMVVLGFFNQELEWKKRRLRESRECERRFSRLTDDTTGCFIENNNFN